MTNNPPPTTPLLVGTEAFRVDGKPLPFRVRDFWAWSTSELLGNTLRGRLAEFLVAQALGVAHGVRREWHAYDLDFCEVKIEVKSAAFLQSWRQKKPSRIAFDIAPTRAWDESTGCYDGVARRQADLYVFCLLDHQDAATIDPLNLAQWKFFVLPTVKLNVEAPQQKRITLSRLLKLHPAVCRFDELQELVQTF